MLLSHVENDQLYRILYYDCLPLSKKAHHPLTYRALLDWYHYHNIPRPVLWAVTSWLAYHFLNEVVEDSSYRGPTVAPIADVYIFDTAGIFLFSFNKVASFFANTLNMRDWSFMPSYNPWLNSIENNGQNFMVRIKLPVGEHWRLMYHWGVHGMYGISYHHRDGNTYSVAGGLVKKNWWKLIMEAGCGNKPANWYGPPEYSGISLMTSLILSGTKGYKARLNIYPGVLKIGKFSPGIFINLRKDNQIVLGMQYSWMPFGIGRQL